VDVTQSARSQELAGRLGDFMAEHIYPNERRFYREAERLGPWTLLLNIRKPRPGRVAICGHGRKRLQP